MTNGDHDGAASEASAAAAAQSFGPILERESISIDGLRALYSGEGFSVLVGTPARARAEEAGARVPHPLAPQWLSRTEDAWVIARVGAAPADPITASLSAYGGTTETLTASLGSLLLSPGVSPQRALLRLGLSRSKVDRALARPITVERERGPSLGGALPGWLRSHVSGGKPVCLSMRRAEAEGTPVDDLAALEVALGEELESSFVEWRGEGERALRERAYQVSLLRVALREATSGRDARAAEVARTCFSRFVVDAPERVHLELDAPPWLDRSRYAPLGPDVPASHARFVKRTLHGIVLGGTPVSVSTTPEVRAGRTHRPHVPRDARLEKLFGYRGVEWDEEGLFSATPRDLARELVRGLRGVVIDATTGLGCLAIAAAEERAVTEVIAIELDPFRLELARHNAALAGVEKRIRFVEGDCLSLVPGMRADALLLDPPWGGPDYDRRRVGFGDLPLDVRPLLSSFRGAIRLKLPRSFDVAELPPGFRPRAAIDERGVVKFLVLERGP